MSKKQILFLGLILGVAFLFPTLHANTPSANLEESLFLKATVNKTEVFLGERVIYTLTLYRRTQFWRATSIQPPSFESVFVDDLPIQEIDHIKTIKLKRYYFSELIKKALFPSREGSLTIESAQVSFILNPSEGKRLISSTVNKIEVLPLPQVGRPENFSGEVGEFSIRLATPSMIIKQYSPFTLTLFLEGNGHLSRIEQLDTPATSDFKLYLSEVTLNQQVDAGLKSIKQFEYILIPQQSGSLRLPYFSFSFFSPQDQKYHRISTPTLSVTVIAKHAILNTGFSLNSQKDVISSPTSGIRPLRSSLLFQYKQHAKFNAEIMSLKIEEKYHNKAYYEALILAQSLLSQYGNHPGVLYNTGTLYHALGKRGQAICLYLRALKYSPNDADIRFNLIKARLGIVDTPLEQIETFWTKTLATFSFLEKKGVVVVTKCAVIAEPNALHAIRFFLHEGATVKIEKERDGWVKIRFNDMLSGWILRQHLWRI